MAVARRVRRRPAVGPRLVGVRYTVDASVFVNAFNPREDGHAESLRVLELIQRRGDPVIVPTLIIPEIAAALARASDDSVGAFQYSQATAALPHLTLVSLTPTMARQAAELAAVHRLRGADAVYLAVARRYGTTLLSRDAEQLTRGIAVATCQSPEEALAAAGSI
jgi:predicted nucleic acid-binding protein